MVRHNLKRTLLITLLTAPITLLVSQRSNYNMEEFLARRTAIMEKIDADMIILFGEAAARPGAPFRQDNDFYYFTGIDDPGSVLVMLPSMKASVLFQPAQSPREIYVSGANILESQVNSASLGFSAISPVADLDEFIVRYAGGNNPVIYARISPQDVVNGDRGEMDLFLARAARSHYNDQVSLNTYRVNKLKERYPYIEFKDIVPAIDELRVFKTDWEQNIMRLNGRISAEGVVAAMRATKPGAFEYQIEAAAMAEVLAGGATGAAYPPIVASGQNSCTLHYEKNSRQTKDGDLVLMDFGACLDYLTMDISRTWPVNGKFSDEQRKVYSLLLEIEKACIEAYKPGTRQSDVISYVKNKLGKMSFDLSGLEDYISHSMRSPIENGRLKVENIISGFGHFVGMAVHDVGEYGDEGLKPGMVFAIEPGLYNPETGIGIRIEDTVLITEDGCEVLTSAVPKEIYEIEKLMQK